ncbi:MAG: SDR family oxidoreductase [Planctomycetaceae bacterium]|nr:SDR family oxidoreductase [Planctomycetaceae bacterium]
MKNVSELFSLKGKVAFISGATGYLGSAMAEALAEAGASVVVSSRNLEKAQQAAGKLPQIEGAVHYAVEMDQMEEDSIQAGFEQAVQLAGCIDILVNNGQQSAPQDWKEVTGEQFTQQLQNATGYFLLSRLLRSHVVERGCCGSVIMLGSMYGIVGSYPECYEEIQYSSPVAYHVLKGGVLQMTRHLAVYWGKDNVRVNSLSPGPFPSSAAPQNMVDRLITKSPMGRMGTPEELKGAIVFLASDASSYMTGQNLVIDGGWTAW